MSWSIALLENTVIVPKKAQKEFNKDEEVDISLSFSSDGKIIFNEDDMEHMDYIAQKSVQRILTKYKVNGCICFGSLGGDNSGKFWGYSFHNGYIYNLEGRIMWDYIF